MERFSIIKKVAAGDAPVACDFLAHHTGLPKARVKDAMAKGAVWLGGRKGGRRRLRRAKAQLRPGDAVEIHYDPAVLAVTAEPAQLIEDLGRYSVWNKPPGMLCQGTDYGDHASLLFQAERHFSPRRNAWPVHRIDREASGLVLVAHDKKAAAGLSALFQKRRIDKGYRATVLGKMGVAGEKGRLDAPLDGKPATTEYGVIRYNREQNSTDVAIGILTGRRHQIRRHFDGIGHPVIGDPRYGRGNKNTAGLQLTADFLAFVCPLTGTSRKYKLS